MIRQNVCQGLAPERLGGLLGVGADLAQHGHRLADDERQRDEDRREHHPGHREDDLDALFGEPVAEPAGLPVDEHEREADDDRRDREGQVDQQAEDRLAQKRPRSSSNAMPTPKRVFSGTAIATISSESQKACMAPGAVIELHTGARPCSKVR